MDKYNSWTIVKEYRDTSGRIRVDTVCDCGFQSSTMRHMIVSGRSKMCRSCSVKKSKPTAKTDETAARATYADYKHKALERNLSFEISYAEFREITKEPCYYCTREPSNRASGKKDGHLDFIYSGLDRVVNTEGYRLDNLVPACKECNYSKRNLGVSEFFAWAYRLTLNLGALAELAEWHDEDFPGFPLLPPEVWK